MIKQQLLFKFNRFSANEVLTAWENADKSKDVILLESANLGWSFDNKVHFIVKRSMKTVILKQKIISLQWISVLQNSITLGYWRDYVNIELKSNIECDNGVWKQKDIYYQ